MTSLVKSTVRLIKPIPPDCSERYAEGWAYADGVIASGKHPTAPNSDKWPHEKEQGFTDRLRADSSSCSAS
jgi:hypothetical protein